MINGDYSCLDRPLHCQRYHNHDNKNHRSVDWLPKYEDISEENRNPNVLPIQKPERNRSLSNNRQQN
jgi:hypothetical protein